jgi:hypothetical protein
MAANPRSVRRTLRAWTYPGRNATEDTGTRWLVVIRVGGVLIAIVMVAIGTLDIVDAQHRAQVLRELNERAREAGRRAGDERLAERSTARDDVEERGVIPIVSYEINAGGADDPRFAGKRYLEVTYLTPDDVDVLVGDQNHPVAGCQVMFTVTGAGTDTVTVNLRLLYSNPTGFYAGDNQGCHVDPNRWSKRSSTSGGIEVTGNPTVLTDGPIVVEDGGVILPAAPGNRVPSRF